MTKKILLQITGMHAEGAEHESKKKEEETVEIVTPAQYFFKNGKHYFVYEEARERGKTSAKSKIKISENAVEIMKNGEMRGNLYFEKDTRTITSYHTPFGQMFFGIWTTGLEMDINEDKIAVDIYYTMEAENSPATDCHVRICACSSGEQSAELFRNFTE